MRTWTTFEELAGHELGNATSSADTKRRIVAALTEVYNMAMDHAREQCDIEEEDCTTEDERARCRSISTACLHLKYQDET